MTLSHTEEEMSRLGATRYFLGERTDKLVDVALHLQDFALPRLECLIKDSEDPIFDDLSRAALEITIENVPRGTKMKWEHFEEFFGEAIHGPNRFTKNLEFSAEGPSFEAFVEKIQRLALEFSCNGNS